MVKILLTSAGDERDMGGEDPLEEEMATHFSILAGRIPWTEEPGGLQSIGHRELDMTERMRARAHTHTHTHTRIVGYMHA